jgi:hypothetical protein
MNAGAIAIATELMIRSDKKMVEKIFDWIEMNVNGQHMYVDHKADCTYIIGESDLFDTPVLLNDYPVYNLIYEKRKGFMLYKTVSTVKL